MQDGFLVELGNFRQSTELMYLKARDCYTAMIEICSKIQLFGKLLLISCNLLFSNNAVFGCRTGINTGKMICKK